MLQKNYESKLENKTSKNVLKKNTKEIEIIEIRHNLKFVKNELTKL